MGEKSIGYITSSPLPDCPDTWTNKDGELCCAHKDTRGTCDGRFCPRLHPTPKLNDFPDVEKLLEKIEGLSLIETDPESPMFGWLIPICPECNGILSHYFGTTKVFCKKCNTTYSLEKIDESKRA